MAITIKTSWQQVNGGKELEEGRNASRWSAARLFHAVCDTISVDNVGAILNHDDIPDLGEGFSVTYPFLTCRRVRVLDPKGPYLFNVLAEYSGKDSPLNDPWKYSIRGQQSMEEVGYDAAGHAYVNPLGHPITGCKRRFCDLVINLTRNEASAAFAQSTTYRNSVNAATVTINGVAYSAGTCLLDDINADNVVEYPDYYWPINYVVAIRADGWTRKELCKGNYYWDGTYTSTGGKRLVAAKTTDGAQYRTVRLAADGTLLPDDGNDVYQTFQDFPSVSWTPLGFA